MGLLVDGKWQTDWYDTETTNGEFIRQDSQFRHWIETGGLFEPEAGRYHLFVSLACPWAHRTLIFRKLKRLETIVGVTIVKPHMLEHGWELGDYADVSPVPDIRYLYEVYLAADPQYSGRVTVPVLWDKKHQRIVNNESADIIRMLNSAFSALVKDTEDYYPQDLRGAIDDINALVYNDINNGVYKVGFATRQAVYERHFNALFSALDRLEDLLAGQRYLVGEHISEADWRLFTTLIRFDSVYYGHFKTNQQQIESYPNLSNYLRDLYQQPGIAETVNLEHIKAHYYYSHDTINPTRIVPLGPRIDHMRPHDRNRFA